MRLLDHPHDLLPIVFRIRGEGNVLSGGHIERGEYRRRDDVDDGEVVRPTEKQWHVVAESAPRVLRCR